MTPHEQFGIGRNPGKAVNVGYPTGENPGNACSMTVCIIIRIQQIEFPDALDLILVKGRNDLGSIQSYEPLAEIEFTIMI